MDITRLQRLIPALAKRDERHNIRPGDMVEILPYQDIQKTLDEHNCLDGLVFMNNMKQFCNKHYRVLKHVKRIYDEKTRKIQYCADIVALDGLVCEGKGMLDGKDCDRCCTLLWKTAWLRPVGSRTP